MTEQIATRSGQFSLDGHHPDARYDAVGFGPLWNGHFTPLVTRETLEAIIHTEDPEKRWYELQFDESEVAHLHYLDGRGGDEDNTLHPDADGHYNLGLLGWLFFDPDTQ